MNDKECVNFQGQFEIRCYDQNNNLNYFKCQKNEITTDGYQNYANILCKILNNQLPSDAPSTEYQAVNLQSNGDFFNQSGELPLLQPIANYKLIFQYASRYVNSFNKHSMFYNGIQPTKDKTKIENQNYFSSNIKRQEYNTLISQNQTYNGSTEWDANSGYYWAYVYKVQRGVNENNYVMYDRLNVFYDNNAYDFQLLEQKNIVQDCVWNYDDLNIQYLKWGLITQTNGTEQLIKKISQEELIDDNNLLNVTYNDNTYRFELQNTDANGKNRVWKCDNQIISYGEQNGWQLINIEGQETEIILFCWNYGNQTPIFIGQVDDLNSSNSSVNLQIKSVIAIQINNGREYFELQDINESGNDRVWKSVDNKIIQYKNWVIINDKSQICKEWETDNYNQLPFYFNDYDNQFLVTFELHNGFCFDVSGPTYPTFNWQIIYDFSGESLKQKFDFRKMPKPIFPNHNGKPTNRQFYGFMGNGCLNDQINSYLFDLYPRSCMIPKAIIILVQQNKVYGVANSQIKNVRYGLEQFKINKFQFYKHKQPINSALNICLKQESESGREYNVVINNTKVIKEEKKVNEKDVFDLCYYGTLGYNDAIGYNFYSIGLTNRYRHSNYCYKKDQIVNLAYSKGYQQRLYQPITLQYLKITKCSENGSVVQDYKLKDITSTNTNRIWWGVTNSAYSISYQSSSWKIKNGETVLYTFSTELTSPLGTYIDDNNNTVEVLQKQNLEQNIVLPLFYKRQLKDSNKNVFLTKQTLSTPIEKVKNSRIDVVYKIKVQI